MPETDAAMASAPAEATAPTSPPEPAPDGAAGAPQPPDPAPAPAAPEGPSFLERMPWWAVPAILLGVPLLVAVVVQAVPEVYDEFVWKYYWGPIKADAENRASLLHDGVEAHSGYNVVNTLTWAALLGVCILGIAQMLVKFRTPMDDKLIVGATAWVVVGSAAHVLEDAGLLSGWLQYLFITPPIYLLFGAFGIGAFLVGQWMKAVEANRGVHGALRVLWLVHIVLVLVWTGLWLKDWPGIVVYVNPLWVALFALVNFLAARALVLRKGTVDPSLMCLVLSLGTYLLVAAYIVTYVLDPWSTPGDGAMPSAAIIAPVLAALAVVVVAAIARGRAKAGSKTAWAYLVPINLLLVFGQMLDAFATSIGIDLAGYSEKHVLSAKVIDVTREFGASTGIGFIERYPTFVGFAPVKLLVSLLVIYAIDVQSKDDAGRHPTLIGLVKFAIIMVGIGPGVRDFTRLALGV
jgi:uncharacterized membrane protein